MITLESITKKLGFDPRHPPEHRPSKYEDDSMPSPYAVLTLEEMSWLCDNNYTPSDVER